MLNSRRTTAVRGSSLKGLLEVERCGVVLDMIVEPISE
jgi:hypothetical protein